MRSEYILRRLRELPLQNQVDVLLRALDFMEQDNARSTTMCIGLALGLPEDPRILGIENIEGHEVTVTFDNGEKRVIHFDQVLDGSRKFHQALLEDYQQFRDIVIAEGTLAWKNLGKWSKDLEGKDVFLYFDIDPGLLYECSTPLPPRH